MAPMAARVTRAPGIRGTVQGASVTLSMAGYHALPRDAMVRAAVEQRRCALAGQLLVRIPADQTTGANSHQVQSSTCPHRSHEACPGIFRSDTIGGLHRRSRGALTLGSRDILGSACSALTIQATSVDWTQGHPDSPNSPNSLQQRCQCAPLRNDRPRFSARAAFQVIGGVYPTETRKIEWPLSGGQIEKPYDRVQSRPAGQLSRNLPLGLNVRNGARRISAVQRLLLVTTVSFHAGQLRRPS